MPGDSGVTVVTNARVYYTPRAAAGALGARHSLRPLTIEGRRFQQDSDVSSREIAKLCLVVIACDKREAFAQRSVSDQSNPFSLAALWIASLMLAMTAKSPPDDDADHVRRRKIFLLDRRARRGAVFRRQ
jgi:hypothetical protein